MRKRCCRFVVCICNARRDSLCEVMRVCDASMTGFLLWVFHRLCMLGMIYLVLLSVVMFASLMTSGLPTLRLDRHWRGLN